MPKTTILLSHERSGSHLLAEIISSFSGMWVFDEVCNAGAVRPATNLYSFHRFRHDWMAANGAEALSPSYQTQVQFLRGYFGRLAEIADGRSVVLDVKYGHIHHFEGVWCPVFRRPFLFEFAEMEGISIIHLYRQSTVEAAISDRIAKARQVWHSWEKRAAETADLSFELDSDEVAADARLLKLQHGWISDQWLGETCNREITYEEMIGSLQDGSPFEDLAEFVGGVARSKLPPLRHQKVTRSIADAVTNLGQVKAACIEAGLSDDPFLMAG